MKRYVLTRVLALLFLLPFASCAAQPTNALAKLHDARRILFLGDSITYAGQYVEAIEAYFMTRFPDRRLEFLNLGLSSETVSGLSEPNHGGGRFPRPDLHERLARILNKVKPDVIFACYGMNDGIYLPFDPERESAYQQGMRRLRDQAALAGARVIHITPPVFDPVPIRAKVTPDGRQGFSGPFEGYNDVLDRYSDWLIARRTDGWEVVDLHGAMNRWLAERRKLDTNFVFARDGVHPDATGHWFIAKQILVHLGATDVAAADTPAAMLAGRPAIEILRLVRSKQHLLRDAWLTETKHGRPGVAPGLPLPEAEQKAGDLDKQLREFAGKNAPTDAAPFPGTRTQWEGFDRYDFEVNGKPAIVIAPKQALPGKPWAWRGEFFGSFAKADAALVGRGFHLVYLRVPNLFGSPAAVESWNTFYDELTKQHGLARRVALIGLSRGGLYCYNWAIANPDKTACIYADAPVCDFKSWPGGQLKGRGRGDGSETEWTKLLKAYGFQSDAEALAYPGNPVDQLKALADAKVPLLHVYGDADTVVPWEENTGVVADRYRKLGGEIRLISKQGVGHHPHGLDDPTPIIEFIVKHAVP